MSEAIQARTNGRRNAIIGILAVVAGIALAIVLFGDALRDFAMATVEWFDAKGNAGLALYAVMQAFAVVVMLPGIFFTLGAGYLFGPVMGTLIMVIGTTVGACVSFLVARYAFTDSVQRRIKQSPRLSAIMRALDDGRIWRTVLLSRMVPFFPFKFSNYLFGTLPISLTQFAVATAIGIIPLTLMNVMIGAMTGDLGALFSGDRQQSPVQLALLAFGLVIATTLYLQIRKRASAALAEADGSRTRSHLAEEKS
ncbi:MAG: TVP38/TMEM64 family protein [Gammaproteobacteria bacterium]|nr:TVP38/TMEM64 family protein [Gammaproteobacteria bacterium]